MRLWGAVFVVMCVVLAGLLDQRAAVGEALAADAATTDGQKVGRWPGRILGFERSPDELRLAIVTGDRQTDGVIVDGQAGPEFDGIGNLVFSPDDTP